MPSKRNQEIPSTSEEVIGESSTASVEVEYQPGSQLYVDNLQKKTGRSPMKESANKRQKIEDDSRSIINFIVYDSETKKTHVMFAFYCFFYNYKEALKSMIHVDVTVNGTNLPFVTGSSKPKFVSAALMTLLQQKFKKDFNFRDMKELKAIFELLKEHGEVGWLAYVPLQEETYTQAGSNLKEYSDSWEKALGKGVKVIDYFIGMDGVEFFECLYDSEDKNYKGKK